MKDDASIKKVYLINQNYGHGQQVSKYAKELLKKKRADVEIVGDDFSPLAQVRDFAPYVAKIKQSGADTVITGNWSADLSLLLKAANDAGLNNVKFYTYYAFGAGAPTAMGAASDGKVFTVGYDYWLSKRTDLYAMVMRDSTRTNTVGSGLLNASGTSFAVGMRHAF